MSHGNTSTLNVEVSGFTKNQIASQWPIAHSIFPNDPPMEVCIQLSRMSQQSLDLVSRDPRDQIVSIREFFIIFRLRTTY